MTYDEELRFAKQQQGRLHGATLPQGTGFTPAPPIYATTGYICPEVVSILKCAETNDAERIIQELDKTVTSVQTLSEKAHLKLEQFSNFQSVDEPAHSGYACKATYFQILESRIQMLQGYIQTLTHLVNSVSATAQTPLTGQAIAR